MDSSIPRRALGKQHGDLLTQALRHKKNQRWVGGGLHDWSVTSTVVGLSSSKVLPESVGPVRSYIQPGLNEHYITSNGGKLASLYSGWVLSSLLRRLIEVPNDGFNSPSSARSRRIITLNGTPTVLLQARSGDINVSITPPGTLSSNYGTMFHICLPQGRRRRHRHSFPGR